MRTRYLYLISIVLIAGCIDDAPRDNPLDPDSPAYISSGSITGVIKIANQSTAIAGAAIADLDESIFVVTDTLGYFVFNHLASGRHTFVCSKENFTNDTFQVEILDRASTHVVRGLNGAPVALSQNILTRKIDYVSFSPKYFVDIVAEVNDPNSFLDLDSVWFSVVDTIFFPLKPVAGTNTFITTIYKNELPTNTIQWLVKKPLHIVSRDRQSAISISDPFFVSRIIENTSTPVFPSQNTLNTDSIYFRWTPPDITFNYTSTVTVYQAGTENVVVSYPGLISFYERYPTDGSFLHLDPGNYFWAISIVDDFGNYSRSKESYFTVN